MSFQLGPKVLIINDPAQAELLFFAKLATGLKRIVETDDDFQTSTPFDDLSTSPDTQSGAEGPGFNPAKPSHDETVAQADMLRVSGFVDLVGSDILEAVGSKCVPGQKQLSTLTFSIPGVLVPGEEVVINVEFLADDLRAEFATYFSDYRRTKQFVITVKPGETPTTLANRFVAHISQTIDSGWTACLTATSAAGVVTLTSTEPKITFRITLEGSAVVNGNITAAFATSTPGYSGRNTYEQLKAVRLETVNYPYAEDYKIKQIPVKGAKYSSYTFKKQVARPDLQGTSGMLNSIPSGVFTFQLYINESLSSYISDFTKWLNANVAKRTMYTAVTANEVLSGDASVTATVVDSVEPFTTPLV
jgi:hypothetical protein